MTQGKSKRFATNYTQNVIARIFWYFFGSKTKDTVQNVWFIDCVFPAFLRLLLVADRAPQAGLANS